MREVRSAEGVHGETMLRQRDGSIDFLALRGPIVWYVMLLGVCAVLGALVASVS